MIDAVDNINRTYLQSGAIVTPRKLYNFYIDPDLADALKQLTEAEHESEGAIVRRALRQYLQQKGVMKSDRKRAVIRKRP